MLVVLASNSIEVEHLHQVLLEKTVWLFEALILEERWHIKHSCDFVLFLCRPTFKHQIKLDLGRARNPFFFLAQAWPADIRPDFYGLCPHPTDASGWGFFPGWDVFAIYWVGFSIKKISPHPTQCLDWNCGPCPHNTLVRSTSQWSSLLLYLCVFSTLSCNISWN